MNKKELEQLFWQMEDLSKQRQQLGEYDTNSKVIMELVSAVRSIVLHAVMEHGRYQPRVRIPKKKSKVTKRK